MSLKKTFLSVSVALLLATSAIAQDGATIEPAPQDGGAVNHIVRVQNMQLTTPGNWYQADVPTDEENVTTVLASNEPADTQALMIISVIPRKGRTLAAFNSMTRNYVVTKMDGVVEYERDRKIQGSSAHTLVYEGRSEHSSQGRRKFMRTVIERGPNFYVLQSVADHVPFANHAGAIESMVNSVSWIQ